MPSIKLPDGSVRQAPEGSTILQVAESTFRRLKGAELLPVVYAGAQYQDGVQRPTRTPQQIAA